MNKCIMIGNLTRDPENNTTPNGVAQCRFDIAVTRSYANASGERETDFFRIVAWRGLAETCGKHLQKGSKVAVSGMLQNRSYEDKQGNKRISTEIVANEVLFLSKSAAAAAPSAPAPAENKPAWNEVPGDDLPF